MIEEHKALGKIKKMVYSKLLSRVAKIRVYRTVIRSVVLCGCETRTLNNNMEEKYKYGGKIQIWKRRVLRRI